MPPLPIPDDVLLRYLCPHLAPGDALRFACACRRHAACLGAAFRRTRAALYHEPASGDECDASPAFTAAAVTSWVRAAEAARRARVAARLPATPIDPSALEYYDIRLHDDRTTVKKTEKRRVDVATLEIYGIHVTGDDVAAALRHIMTSHRPARTIRIVNLAHIAHALRDEHLAIVAGVTSVRLYHHAMITDAGIEALGTGLRVLEVSMCMRVAGDFLPRRIYHDRAPLIALYFQYGFRSLSIRPRIRAWLVDQIERGLLVGWRIRTTHQDDAA